MKYRFLHVSALNPQTDEKELHAFCPSHRIASNDKAFIEDGASSFCNFCVGNQEGSEAAPAMRNGRIDYREVLSEGDFAIFVRLRILRKTLAELEGDPAYALFTNEQLAEIVTRNARSAQRNHNMPDNPKNNTGFRLARVRCGARWRRTDPACVLFVSIVVLAWRKATGRPYVGRLADTRRRFAIGAFCYAVGVLSIVTQGDF